MSGNKIKAHAGGAAAVFVDTGGRSKKAALDILGKLQVQVKKSGVVDGETAALLNQLAKRLNEPVVPATLRQKAEKNLRSLVAEQGPRLRKGDQAEIVEMLARKDGLFEVLVQLWAQNAEELDRPMYKWQTVRLILDGQGRAVNPHLKS